MSVLTHTEEDVIRTQFEDLLAHCVHCESKTDQRLIRKAYNLAYEAHK